MCLEAESKKVVLWTAVVLLLAVLIRVFYFFQFKNTPFFLPIENSLDPQLYIQWAQRIAAGDWIGEGVFPGMPLYAYFLGVLFVVFKNSIIAAILVQLILSAFNCVLIFFIAKRLFNIKIAVIAGIISCVYAPFLFNDTLITSSILITFLNCLAIYLLLSFENKKSLSCIIFCGITLGLAALARATVLMFLPFIALWIIFAFKELRITKRFFFCAILTLSVFIVIIPITIRNYLITGEKVLITSYGGINFYIGNNPSADGRFSPPKGMRADSEGLLEDSRKIAEKILGKELTLTQASNFWVQNTKELITENPFNFLRALTKKFCYFWSVYEIPDVLDFYFIKKYVPMLRLPLFSFMIIGPLGLLGLVLSLNKSRKAIIIYFFLVSYIGAIMMFFINSRYRLTVTPIMIIFSAFALDKIFTSLKSKKYNLLKKQMFILLGFVIFTNLPIEKSDYAVSYNNLGLALIRDGKLEASEKAFLKALEIKPVYAVAYNNLGNIYYRQNKMDKAKEFFEKAFSLNPE
ncbi:MAG: tetratricopeptide repeat protein, partial [Candidatus Omnitrophota bacterium]